MLLLNILVDFISMTIFWFVLLFSITCISLGISFFINIKYEIIELPECLGGNGFSINFCQNQEKNFSQHIIDSGFTEEESKKVKSDDGFII